MSKRADVSADTVDIQYEIEIATQTLDRNMGLVSSCDNKASIMLALFGVLLGFVLSEDGIDAVLTLASEVAKSSNVVGVFYLICLLLAAVAVVIGICYIAMVLVARGTKEGKEKGLEDYSQLYFREIAKKEDFSKFQSDFKSMSREAVLNAILKDIYQNALIAKKKYTYYNIGFKIAAIGFLAFTILLVLGMITY